MYLLENSDVIIDIDGAARKNFGEDAFLGHNAISCLFIYFTFFVTFFTDLGDLKLYLADFEFGADWEFGKIDSCRSYIFCK